MTTDISNDRTRKHWGSLSGLGAAPRLSSGRWFAIVNPASGAMRRKRFRDRWLPEVRRSAAGMAFCDGPGHATKLATEALDYDGIVVVGGDGTVFEVIAGLNRKQHCLAVLPAGRGNSLARDLGVSDMTRALAALRLGTTRRLDLLALEAGHDDGRVTRELCASTVAIGYVASVGKLARRFVPAGTHSYTVATIFSKPYPLQTQLSYDGSTPRSCALTGLLASNVAHVAHYCPFPGARPDDGLIHVMELNAGWTRQLFHNLSVLTRSYLVGPARSARCRSVTAVLHAATDLLVDGEIMAGVTGFALQCIPGSIDCRMARAP